MPARLVLASASPARAATLRRAGIAFDVVVSGVDETDVDAGSAADTALALARRKARAVTEGHAGGAPVLVLGCDSVLELGGRTYGKPRDAADAVASWRQMRGREGVLHTGHCLVDVARNREVSALASTVVRFADVTDAEIDAYVATGEPLRVAGAFTIDGLGGAFVAGIDGDHHNVVGLSLPLLRRMLGQLGVAWTDLWTG